jgi:hypothetical protein
MRCTYGHKKIQTIQTINIGLYMCRRVTAVQSGVQFVFFPFFLKRKTCEPGRNTIKGTVSQKHIGSYFWVFTVRDFQDVPLQWEHTFVQRTSPISLLLLLSVESTRRWARESNPGLTLHCPKTEERKFNLGVLHLYETHYIALYKVKYPYSI